MKTIKINKQDEDIFFSVISTYPLYAEDDKESKKFNKDLERLRERIRIQMKWRVI